MNPEQYTTPNDRDILSHYYCGPDEHPRVNALAVQDAIRRFVDHGLLVELSEPNAFGARYAANHDALRVYMDALAAIPLPVCRWVIP